MLKHLIYYDYHLDIRAGGPPGYLANLRCGLDRIDNPEDYAVELWSQKKPPHKAKVTKWKTFVSKFRFLKYLYANYLSKTQKRWYRNFCRYLEESASSSTVQEEVIEKLKQGDIKLVHCHHACDALRVLNTLKRENISGVKVALTSHTPEIPSAEWRNLILEMGYSTKKAEKIRKLWKVLEHRAFRESDILIFPSVESMEPYYETEPAFASWIEKKDVRFFRTGAFPLTSPQSREELRKQYNIPDGSKVVAYIGRHVEVKGYDVLIEAGRNILRRRKDTLFLVGGKANTLMCPPRSRQWRELGWCNPSELLKVADVFVLPNRRTFFDLILLEVMSMGTPVIASATGGNKTVQNETNALILYESGAHGLEEALHEFLNRSEEQRAECSRRILQAYQNHYTPEHFAQRYLNLVRKIYQDYNLLPPQQ